MVSDAFHTSSQRAMCKCFLSLPTNNWLNGFCKSKAVWSISGPYNKNKAMEHKYRKNQTCKGL